MHSGCKRFRGPKYLQQNSLLCDFTTFDYSWFWKVAGFGTSNLLLADYGVTSRRDG